MEFSLIFSAVLVLALWIVILGIYLYVSRRQPKVVREIETLEAKLDQTPEE